MEFDLYKDIQKRTNGEIYIGVVGPVRTGKSTFIKRFMDLFVLPYIEDEEEKKHKLTKKEIKAKEHLEQMVEITKKIGYNDVGIQRKNKKLKNETFKMENQKERE